MTIFARVRDGFTVVLDGIVHEAGAVLRLAEGVFGLHAHKLEVIPAEAAASLPIANAPAAAEPAPARAESEQTDPAAAGEKAGSDGGASDQPSPAAPADEGASTSAGAPAPVTAPAATEPGAA